MPDLLHHLEFAPDSGSALDSVRVVDLSRLVADNVTSYILANHGAEVIKVEKPGKGDELRDWFVEGVATYWKVYGRNKKRVALALIADFMRQGTQREVPDLCAAAGVTVAPVYDAADVAVDRYVIERERLVTVEDAEMGRLLMHNVVSRLSKTPGAIRRPAPTTGQHSDEIVRELGLDSKSKSPARASTKSGAGDP